MVDLSQSYHTIGIAFAPAGVILKTAIKHCRWTTLRSPLGHLRRNHVDAMSAIAPIATELLREDNGRKGPVPDSCTAAKTYLLPLA